ncbi:MAG: hypothetical protein WC829_03155 [Hyphomicrobium sp.]|jgi:hypothetical protein
MNTIPRMDDSLLCRLMNVRIIGSGRLPEVDIQTITDAIEAMNASDMVKINHETYAVHPAVAAELLRLHISVKALGREAWTWSKTCENACKSDYAAREHLRLAIDHITALNGALEDLASLGATVALCGTKYDDAAARECLLPATVVAGPEKCVPPDLLSWAVDRWLAEVGNRPLVNKNRRTLDDTWRQVIRFAGGEPDELIGPSHDVLLADAQPKPANQQKED